MTTLSHAFGPSLPLLQKPIDRLYRNRVYYDRVYVHLDQQSCTRETSCMAYQNMHDSSRGQFFLNLHSLSEIFFSKRYTNFSWKYFIRGKLWNTVEILSTILFMQSDICSCLAENVGPTY